MQGTRLIFVVALLVLLGACATTPKQVGAAFAQSSLAEELDKNWVVEVSNQSLTFVPKAYPADAPRASSHGEWVYVGEESSMRWFVPKNGVENLSREKLHEQATEGSVALQVAGIRPTVQNIQWWGKKTAVNTASGVLYFFSSYTLGGS